MPAEPAGGSGSAGNAQVQTGPPALPADVQALREQLADEAEQAVKAIEDKLAGTKEALAAKKAEAKQLRKQADEGREA